MRAYIYTVYVKEMLPDLVWTCIYHCRGVCLGRRLRVSVFMACLWEPSVAHRRHFTCSPLPFASQDLYLHLHSRHPLCLLNERAPPLRLGPVACDQGLPMPMIFDALNHGLLDGQDTFLHLGAKCPSSFEMSGGIIGVMVLFQ